MLGVEIFEKISDLKEKFKDFFQQRKQMTALENHALVKKFTDSEQEVLGAIKYCMKGSFLEEEDAEWITRKLNRLHINYLDWAHRTKWLKEQIEPEKAEKQSHIYQTFFDFVATQPTKTVCPEILNLQRKPKMGARL